MRGCITEVQRSVFFSCQVNQSCQWEIWRNTQTVRDQSRLDIDMSSANWLLVNTLTEQKSLSPSGDHEVQERKEKRRWKSIKLSPSSPLNSRTGGKTTSVGCNLLLRKTNTTSNLQSYKIFQIISRFWFCYCWGQMVILMEMQIYMWGNQHQSVICASGILQREADGDAAARIRAITTFWISSTSWSLSRFISVSLDKPF